MDIRQPSLRNALLWDGRWLGCAALSVQDLCVVSVHQGIPCKPVKDGFCNEFAMTVCIQHKWSLVMRMVSSGALSSCHSTAEIERGKRLVTWCCFMAMHVCSSGHRCRTCLHNCWQPCGQLFLRAAVLQGRIPLLLCTTFLGIGSCVLSPLKCRLRCVPHST